MIDDAGTLIDMSTRDTYDYVSDVVELLNQLHEENKELRAFQHNVFKNMDKAMKGDGDD